MGNILSKKNKTAVALGTFDGIHLGHRCVLQSALDSGNEQTTPCVLLFDCHPLLFLTGKSPKKIISDKKKDEILDKMGLKREYCKFSDIFSMTPAEFVDKILVERLNASTVSCGFNYTFGLNASGDVNALKKLLCERDIDLKCVNEVKLDGEKISSTKIRELIENGEIEKANRMLGRFFSYESQVVHGFERGRTLGFPTINQYFSKENVEPKSGVYASLAVIDGKKYPSFTDIGVSPTFGSTAKKSETHIFDCREDLYGSVVEIELVGKIRDEVKMKNGDELKKQLEIDCVTAKKIIERDKNIYG